MKTLGISPKVLVPLAPALSAFAAAWITTGHLSRELVAALVSASIGAVLAYYASPGIVVDDNIVTPEHELMDVVGGDGSNVKPDVPKAP